MRRIEIVDYDSKWPSLFEEIHSLVWPSVRDLALAVEHVGSTAVPGLAAKPVIDVCVVVPSEKDVQPAIQRLETLGYRHRGNLGIPDREAFSQPADPPRHHLYLSPSGSVSLLNQLGLRDYLRSHPDAAKQYGSLKKRLAKQHSSDIDQYINGKTEFILGVLSEVGLPQSALENIRRVNTPQDLPG